MRRRRAEWVYELSGAQVAELEGAANRALGAGKPLHVRASVCQQLFAAAAAAAAAASLLLLLLLLLGSCCCCCSTHLAPPTLQEVTRAEVPLPTLGPVLKGIIREVSFGRGFQLLRVSRGGCGGGGRRRLTAALLPRSHPLAHTRAGPARRPLDARAERGGVVGDGAALGAAQVQQPARPHGGAHQGEGGGGGGGGRGERERAEGPAPIDGSSCVAANSPPPSLRPRQDIGHDATKPETRLYATAAAQPIHNDGPADVVGLLCLTNAAEGGLSQWSSSTAVYNEILRR